MPKCRFNTVKPVGLSLQRYLSDNYPKLPWIAQQLLRKKIAKANYKYFSGHRNQETFERYKTYRLMVYQQYFKSSFTLLIPKHIAQRVIGKGVYRANISIHLRIDI